MKSRNNKNKKRVADSPEEKMEAETEYADQHTRLTAPDRDAPEYPDEEGIQWPEEEAEEERPGKEK